MSNKSKPFFYYAELSGCTQFVTLDSRESRHVSSARRLQVEDELILFDGLGRLANASIKDIGKQGRNVVVEIADIQTRSLANPSIHLLYATPKGERQNVLLDMVTQLGVDRITPLICERSVVTPKPQTLDRWRRVVLEACKQSRRAWVPDIEPPISIQQLLKTANTSDVPMWVADPSGESYKKHNVLPRAFNQCQLIIGPEGGLSESELEQLRNTKATLLNLGPNILRIETAAVAMLIHAQACSLR